MLMSSTAAVVMKDLMPVAVLRAERAAHKQYVETRIFMLYRAQRAIGLPGVTHSWGFITKVSIVELEFCNYGRHLVFRHILGPGKLFKRFDAAVHGQYVVAFINEVFGGQRLPELWIVGRNKNSKLSANGVHVGHVRTTPGTRHVVK